MKAAFTMKAAFILFGRMTLLNLMGFYDAVSRLKSMKIQGNFEWQHCAMTRRVIDHRGLKIGVDAGAL